MDSFADVSVMAGADANSGPPAADSLHAKRPAAADPLVYLREYVSQKKKVQFEDDWLVFGDHRIHRSTKCAFVLQKGGTLVDIGSIWFMFRETSADRTYTQHKSTSLNFTYIGIDRRGDLCDFLLGRTDTCPGLVKEVLEGRKRPRDAAPRDRAAKKGKVDPAAPPAEDGKDPQREKLSYEDVMTRVRSVQDLDVVIRRPGRMVPNANMILKIAQEEWQAFSKGVKKADPVGAKEKTRSGKLPLHAELEDMLRKDERNVPIILVPCNKLAPVNMLNCQEFLQEGRMVRPNKERTNFFESTRPEFVQVKRNIKNKVWTFEVRDSVKNFTKSQWLRTVMVITDGNEWQFKGWPFETIVDLFGTITGVWFMDINKPIPTHVNQWPCMKLEVPQLDHQHRWASHRDSIFMNLEAFMSATRPKKFVNNSHLDNGRRTIRFDKNVL